MFAKIFKNSFFIENLQWLLFSVPWSNCLALGICQPSFLNQKHNVGSLVLKRFVDLFRVCYIISRNHSICWLPCRKQKLVQSKTLQQGYLCSYQTFDSLDILISTELSLVLRKFKLHQGNWQGREVCFNEICPCIKGGERYYIDWLQNNNQKENRHILHVYMAQRSTKR